jgi:MFS family permease
MRASSIWFLTYAANMAVWTFVPILARDELGIGNGPIGIAVFLYSSALFLASYVFGRARSTGLLGRFSAWGSLGWGVGALLAGLLAAYYDDLTWAFLLAAGIYLLAFVIAIFLPKVEQVRMRVPLFPKDLIKRNIHFYLPMLVRHAGAMAIWTFWPLYLIDLGADYVWVGIIQFINPLAQFCFMWLVTDKVRSTLLFPIGLVLSAVTFVTFVLARNMWELLPTQILLGVSWGCTYVGALRGCTESSKEKATAAGLFNSTTSMSAILGPLFATVLVGFTGSYETTMLFASAMAVVSLGLYYGLRKMAEEDLTSSA